MRGDVEGLRQALHEGANANCVGKAGGETALHIASRKGHLEVVRELLLVEADVSIANAMGKTPSDLAAQQQHLEVKELLEKPREPDMPATTQSTMAARLLASQARAMAAEKRADVAEQKVQQLMETNKDLSSSLSQFKQGQ